MKETILNLKQKWAELKAEEDSQKQGELIAGVLKYLQEKFPPHLDSIELKDFCRTIRYFILVFSRNLELAEKAASTFSEYCAYNLMRIERSEMNINGLQADILSKLMASTLTVRERANGYHEKYIESLSVDYKDVFQEIAVTISSNYPGITSISDRTFPDLLLRLKLNMLESQYTLLMKIHLAITGFDEPRALKELISHYSRVVKSPRKQLDLFQAPFLEKSILISKETANQYCLKALEFFSTKLEILDPMHPKPDLEHLRSNYLPQYKSCFISYTGADYEVADFLHYKLKSRGISCWLDKHEIFPGDNLQASIYQGIHSNDKVILICSKSALQSWWVKDEFSKAITRERAISQSDSFNSGIIIPITVDQYIYDWNDPVANQIKDRNILDFRKWNRSYRSAGEKFEKLLQALLVKKYYDNSNLPLDTLEF